MVRLSWRGFRFRPLRTRCKSGCFKVGRRRWFSRCCSYWGQSPGSATGGYQTITSKSPPEVSGDTASSRKPTHQPASPRGKKLEARWQSAESDQAFVIWLNHAAAHNISLTRSPLLWQVPKRAGQPHQKTRGKDGGRGTAARGLTRISHTRPKVGRGNVVPTTRRPAGWAASGTTGPTKSLTGGGIS